MIERIALFIVLGFACLAPKSASASELAGVFASDENAPSTDDEAIAPQVTLAIKITLKDQVTTGQSRLYLKDVASCAGHASVCEELEAVDVGPSPEPGRMRVLLRREIAQTVARETSHDVKVEGPDSLRVTADFREVDAAAIREAIQTRLARMNENLEQVEVHLKQVLPLKRLRIRPANYDITVPEWDAVLDPSGNGMTMDDEWAVEHLSGAVRTSVKVQIEGEDRVEEVPLRLQLECYRLFPVAAHTLARGATIAAGDLKMEKKRLGPSSRLWLTDARGLEGKVLRMQLKAGDIPTPSMLVTPLVVKRGEVVDLAIQTGGVALKGRGRTLMSGAVGDTIDVLYLATKKQLKGRVTGPSKVEVSL